MSKPSTFVPTHKITVVRGDKTEIEHVLLDEGRAYTRAEWEAETSADWELVDGEWLFQGAVPICDEYSVDELLSRKTFDANDARMSTMAPSRKPAQSAEQ